MFGYTWTRRLFLLAAFVFAASGNAALMERDAYLFAVARCEACRENNKPTEFLDRTVTIENETLEARGIEIGQRFIYNFEDNCAITLDVIEVPGRTLQFVVEQSNKFEKPTLFINVDTNCSLRIARRMVYKNNVASHIEHLDENSATTGQRDLLNPPIPNLNSDLEQKPDPLVAMIDSGVNYTLPQIANNRARDSKEKILSYDFWEMDALPFDSQFSHSPFFVTRHGTRTASLRTGNIRSYQQQSIDMAALVGDYMIKILALRSRYCHNICNLKIRCIYCLIRSDDLDAKHLQTILSIEEMTL